MNGPAYGDQHHNARISEEAVLQMLAERAAGAELRPLAARYGISLAQVGRICRGERRGWARDIDESELQPLRVCRDPLPVLPPRVPTEGPGERAFFLMATALQQCALRF